MMRTTPKAIVCKAKRLGPWRGEVYGRLVCWLATHDDEARVLIPTWWWWVMRVAFREVRFPVPGDCVAALAKALGFRESEGCGCRSWRARMNRAGWRGFPRVLLQWIGDRRTDAADRHDGAT